LDTHEPPDLEYVNALLQTLSDYGAIARLKLSPFEVEFRQPEPEPEAVERVPLDEQARNAVNKLPRAQVSEDPYDKAFQGRGKPSFGKAAPKD
jgi:hypothetical protein